MMNQLDRHKVNNFDKYKSNSINFIYKINLNHKFGYNFTSYPLPITSPFSASVAIVYFTYSLTFVFA